MNKFLLTGIATAALIAPAAQAANWGTNLPAALKQAGETGKNVFVIFTGSDWCGPCIALKNNVLSKADFAAYADENFVLVELDFPRSKPMSAEQKAANSQASEKYGVKGFPTVLVLSPEGEELARMVGGVSDLAALKEKLAGATGGESEDSDAADQEKFMALVSKLKGMEDPEELYDYTSEQLDREDLTGEEEIALHFYQSTAIVELATTEEELEELLEILRDDIIPAYEEDYSDELKPIKDLVELLEDPEFIEGYIAEKAE